MTLMHSRQVFLDKINVEKSHATKKQKVSMINWNISNPSLQRAIKQVEWLVEKKPRYHSTNGNKVF